MTIDELYKFLDDLIKCGHTDEEIFVRKLGESFDTIISKVKFVNLVSSFSSYDKVSIVELVYN